MTDDDDLRRRAMVRGNEVLGPIAADLAAALGIEDRLARDRITDALVEAFLAGAEFQAVEITAQLIEAGIDARLRPAD